MDLQLKGVTAGLVGRGRLGSGSRNALEQVDDLGRRRGAGLVEELDDVERLFLCDNE